MCRVKNKQIYTYKDMHHRNTKCAPFLAGSVPDLSFNRFMLDNQRARLEFDTDRSFGVQAELVARETGEYLRLPDGGVAD